MLSQLVDANITNIGGIGSNWTGTYTYKANGDMVAEMINDTSDFGFAERNLLFYMWWEKNPYDMLMGE